MGGNKLPRETKVYLIWGNGAGPAVIEAYISEQAVEFFLASHGMFSYKSPFNVIEIESVDLIAQVRSLIPRNKCEELVGHHKFEMVDLEKEDGR